MALKHLYGLHKYLHARELAASWQSNLYLTDGMVDHESLQGTPSDSISASKADIEACFSMKRAAAAAKLGMSESKLRLLCRTHGIAKWPYRSVSYTRM